MLKRVVRRADKQARKVVLCALHLQGCLLGHLLYTWRSCRFYYCHTNINLCFPQFCARQVYRLARASLTETGKLVFEMSLFWLALSGFYRRLIINVYGEEHLSKARAAGHGVILVLPHLGNWEVFNVYTGRYTPLVLYKPLRPCWFDRWVRRCRARVGSTLVPITNEGIKAMCVTLKQGGVVTLLPDQVPADNGRVLVPFFGVPAWTGTLVSRLAQRPNVTVVFGFAERKKMAQGFDIHFLEAPPEIYSKDIEQSASALNQGIEACIRLCPEQYTWSYKRFKETAYKCLYHKSKMQS